MFERLTLRARQVVVLAQEEARYLKHSRIGTEHMLLGVVRVEENAGAQVLAGLDITAEKVRTEAVRLVGTGDEPTNGLLPFTPRAKDSLQKALREALSLGRAEVGPEDILFGLLGEKESTAVRILLNLDADPNVIHSETISQLSAAKSGTPHREPAWNEPGVDPLKRAASVALGVVASAKEIAHERHDDVSEAELTEIEARLAKWITRLLGEESASGDS